MKHLKRPSHSSNQILLLDQNALIVESCDSIFSTQALKDKPVVEWLPFLESIYGSLIEMNVGTPEILFSKVEEPHPLLPGFYDFTFIPLSILGEKYILWTIYDFTFVYMEIKRHQQVHNELEIKRQRLELKIQSLLKKNIELYEGIEYSASQKRIRLLLQANSSHLTNVLEDFVKILQEPDQPSILQKNSLSIKELMEDIKDYISINYQTKFNFTKSENTPPYLIGDVFLLKQILYNIVIPLADLNANQDIYISRVKNQKNKKRNYTLLFQVVTDISDISHEELSDALSEFNINLNTSLVDDYTNLLIRLYLNQLLIKAYGEEIRIEESETGQLMISFVITFKQLT